MARKRDVVVAVVIGVSFLIAFGLMTVVFVGMFAGEGDLPFAGLGGNVGLVEIYGTINEPMGRRAIDHIDRWADKSSIKAIVLHINSPGGGVAISQEIYDAVLRAREEKPVVAAMASVAASGGIYVACGADRIVANPGTLTGSIGVIFQFHTAEGLLDKIGLETETIKSGELKDVGSYARSMTGKEELMLRSVVMDTYEQFVDVVATGRGMEAEKVRPLADGSVFTGLQAYNLGLVDTLGGLEEAIDLAAELAEIEGDVDLVRPYERDDVSIFDILGSAFGAIGRRVDAELAGPRLMYLYR